MEVVSEKIPSTHMNTKEDTREKHDGLEIRNDDMKSESDIDSHEFEEEEVIPVLVLPFCLFCRERVTSCLNILSISTLI